MDMMSKTDLSPEELETVKASRLPTTVITANGVDRHHWGGSCLREGFGHVRHRPAFHRHTSSVISGKTLRRIREFLKMERSNTKSYSEWQHCAVGMRQLRAHRRSRPIKWSTPYEFSRRWRWKDKGVDTWWTRNVSGIEKLVAGFARMGVGIHG